MSKEQICVVVNAEVAGFLKELAVGKALKFKRLEEDIEKVVFLDPIMIEVCGRKSDMISALSNVHSKKGVLEYKFEMFEDAVKQFIRIGIRLPEK